MLVSQKNDKFNSYKFKLFSNTKMSDKKFAFSKPSIIYLSIVIVILIITGSIIFFDSQSIFTEQLIYTSAQNTESELNKFFNPISNSLQKIRQDVSDGKHNLNGDISLNNYFIPLLKSSKTISSVKYFDSSGQQYLLYQENNTFVSTFRIEKLFNNEVVWKRWSDVDKQMSEWKQNIEKDPIRQNWVNYFHSQSEKDSIYWLRLKGFGDVTIGEITSVSFGNIGQSDTIFGCGIGINIDNLVSSLSEVKLYSDPKIFLINSRDHIIPILMDYKKTDKDI